MSGGGPVTRLQGCDEVRLALPEHLLGTLASEDDAAVRRHLRGCAACRRELAQLGEGLSTFARAAHQAEPPADLKDRVLQAVAEERAASGQRAGDAVRPVATRGPRRMRARMLAVAAAVAIAATSGWAVAQSIRASNLSERAHAYQKFLDALGGRDVRVAELQAAGTRPVEGTAVLYDSDGGRSWVLVLVRSPGATGTLQVILQSPRGRILMHPVEFDPDGDTDSWLVTSADLSRYDRVRVLDGTGHLLATGRVTKA